jgi:lambda family phage portal protein
MGKPSAFTSFIDKAVAVVAPKWGVERAVSRAMLRQFDYDGARHDGRRGTTGGTLFRNASPESQRIQQDAIQLMWESRDMESNFCLWRGILTRTTQYALGKIVWQSRTGDAAVDEAHEAYWEQWGKRADLTQRHPFPVIARLGIRSMLRDRDFGIALHDDEATGEYRIRGIEADRIGNPLMPVMPDEKKVQGIVLGEHGEPVSYQIYKRKPTNQYDMEVELPPERFLHIFDPLRVDQYRGVGWGAPALPHMRDLYEALGAEMQAIKFAASYAAFTYNEQPFSQQAATQFDSEKKPDGGNKYSVLPGTIQNLTAGQKIEFAPGASRPSGAFMAWFEAKVREISVGLNVPFGFVWNLALLGGVTARIEVAQMKRTLDDIRTVAMQRMLDPLKDKVLRRGIALGLIPSHPKFGTGRWSFGPDITGDVGHDTNADISLLQAGIFSESYLIEGKYGGDFEEHAYQQAREITTRQRIAQETGVPIELQTSRLAGATAQIAAMNARGDPDAEGAVLDQAAPEQAAPAAEEAGAPPVPAGLAAAHGKDAVKGLIEVMKRLNLGELTREQAVQILVASYGMDLSEAEMVVPGA